MVAALLPWLVLVFLKLVSLNEYMVLVGLLVTVLVSLPLTIKILPGWTSLAQRTLVMVVGCNFFLILLFAA
jgi:hypothetical protein